MPAVMSTDVAAQANSTRSMPNSSDPPLPVVHFAWPLNRCSRLTFGSAERRCIEHRAGGLCCEPLLHELLLAVGQRHVTDFGDER